MVAYLFATIRHRKQLSIYAKLQKKTKTLPISFLTCFNILFDVYLNKDLFLQTSASIVDGSCVINVEFSFSQSFFAIHAKSQTP